MQIGVFAEIGRGQLIQFTIAVIFAEVGQRRKRDVYSGRLKLDGEEAKETLRAANNYAATLFRAKRFEEAKSVLRKTMPAAQRVLGEKDHVTLVMRKSYGESLCRDPSATLDDLREAVATLEETAPIARRVLGGAHPVTMGIEVSLRNARAALRARETPPPRRA